MLWKMEVQLKVNWNWVGVMKQDHLPNVLGAKAVGIEAIQFENVEQCKSALRKYEIQC